MPAPVFLAEAVLAGLASGAVAAWGAATGAGIALGAVGLGEAGLGLAEAGFAPAALAGVGFGAAFTAAATVRRGRAFGAVAGSPSSSGAIHSCAGTLGFSGAGPVPAPVFLVAIRHPMLAGGRR
ncbi:MAG: hypothetical protein ABR573_08530 [Candidatus Dormibacteria bacterium]